LTGKLIKYGEFGDRVGDSNPAAVYSDAEVEVMRQMREDGMLLRVIADKFDCTKGYVSKVCNYHLRVSLVVMLSTAKKWHKSHKRRTP